MNRDGLSLILGYTPAAEATWQEGLAALNINPQHIHTIVLTHFHPDHFDGRLVVPAFWRHGLPFPA